MKTDYILFDNPSYLLNYRSDGHKYKVHDPLGDVSKTF